MKKYISKSKSVATIKFEDGSSQFLFFGQKFETDKKVASVSSGVVEQPKPKQPHKNKKKVSEEPVQEQSDVKNEDSNGDNK